MDGKQAIASALQVIGFNGLDGISVKAPSASAGLATLLKRHRVYYADFGRLLVELKRRDLVQVSPTDQGYHFVLTISGVHRLQQILVNQLKIPRPRRWDGKWRAVTFDIPIKFSTQRAYFTQHLQRLGFVMLQKSLWVYPFPCFNEVEQLAGHYNLARYCSMMEIDKLDKLATDRLLRRFDQVLNT